MSRSSALSWNEWLAVKEGLVAEALQTRVQAQHVVALWRARQAIPHSVDISAEMAQIMERDCLVSPIQPSICYSARELTNLYSLAVIRAINGITEGGQQGYFAKSVMSIAEGLGLPGWIVELRHDATHAALPSLSVLRSACQYLLTWYSDNYWTPQFEELNAMTMRALGPFRKNDEDLGLTFMADYLAPLFVSSVRAAPPGEALEQCLASWRSRVASLPPKYTTTAVHCMVYRLVGEACGESAEPTTTLDRALQELEAMLRTLNVSRRMLFLSGLAATVGARTDGCCPASAQMRLFLQTWCGALLPPDAPASLPPSRSPEDEDATQPPPSSDEGSKKRSLDDLEAWLSDLAGGRGTEQRSGGSKAANGRKKARPTSKLPNDALPRADRVAFQDSCTDLQGARLCVDYPLWPVGLVPGTFEAQLHLLRER